MTGRRLYDHYTDALKSTKGWGMDSRAYPDVTAWPFLTDQQRRHWNDLAKRITPRKRA